MIEDGIGVLLKAGATIRGYRIGAPLGERYPSTAFRARRGAEAPVVLKIVRLLADPERDDAILAKSIALRVQRISVVSENALRHARAEGAGVHSSSSPLVAAILDHWQQDDLLFVVTEQFGQRTLRDALEDAGSSALDLDVAIDLAIMAVTALAQTHEATYHLNIKPSNLLLDARIPEIRLTDFDLLDREPAHDAEALTYTWTPERLSGELAYNQSDIYSMAAIVYALLTGEPPYRCTTLAEAARLHTRGLLRSPHELQPRLPAELSDCLVACLSRRPAARPAAATLLARLEAAQDALGFARGAASEGDSPTGVERQFWPQLKLMRQGDPPVYKPLEGSGLTLGGQGAHTLELGDSDLTDTRIQVDWDGVTAWFVCAGETAPVMFERAPVQPQTPYAWPLGTVLSAGSYTITIEPPHKKLDLPEGLAYRTASAVDEPEAVLSPDLEVQLMPRELTVVPGKPVPLTLTLSNRGTQVDTLTLTVEELPQAWVAGLGTLISLNPGDRRTLTLTVAPPLQPSSAVGVYRLAVRATSALAPNEYQRDTIRVVVGPFSACRLALHPESAAAFSKARFGLLVQNDSNAPARFRLSAEDPRGRLAFSQQRESVDLAAGQRQVVPLDVRARPWHLFGPPIERPFNVEAVSSSGAARASGAGTLQQWSLIPAWLPWLLLALLAIGALLTYLYRPFVRLDAELEAWPLYGILNPPPPTSPPTLTPTIDLPTLAVAPLVVPPLPPTITSSAAPRPTREVPPPPPTITSTPTDIPSPTPSATPTPAPAVNGALIDCPREQPILIEGQFLSQQRYRLAFHNYAASLGVLEQPGLDLATGPDGRFVIPLIIGTNETPGIYRVQVESLDTDEIPRTFYCRLLPPGVSPPPTPTATATPRPTATPFFSPTPTATLPAYVRRPWPTPTPTLIAASPTPAPVADGSVRVCFANAQLTIEGEGPPGAELIVTVDGVPLATDAGAPTFGPIAEDGSFLITPRLGEIAVPRVVAIIVATTGGEVRRTFYCAVYDEPPTATLSATPAQADTPAAPTPTLSAPPVPVEAPATPNGEPTASATPNSELPATSTPEVEALPSPTPTPTQ